MFENLKDAWSGIVQPMLQRPKKIQFAALCYRTDDSGKRVLLVTSRDTGRWIIPKGWPITGMDSAETAMQEAWEEAGVRKGKSAKTPIGSYTYEKGLSSGWTVSVETVVYPVAVEELRKDFPEAHERNRKWVSPQEAAELVDEPELKAILAEF